MIDAAGIDPGVPLEFLHLNWEMSLTHHMPKPQQSMSPGPDLHNAHPHMRCSLSASCFLLVHVCSGPASAAAEPHCAAASCAEECGPAAGGCIECTTRGGHRLLHKRGRGECTHRLGQSTGGCSTCSIAPCCSLFACGAGCGAHTLGHRIGTAGGGCLYVMT